MQQMKSVEDSFLCMTGPFLLHRGFDTNGSNEGIPVVLITKQEDLEEDDSNDEWLDILPLPASKYRYTKWHEIEEVIVPSSSLRAPRVRKGKNVIKYFE